MLNDLKRSPKNIYGKAISKSLPCDDFKISNKPKRAFSRSISHLRTKLQLINRKHHEAYVFNNELNNEAHSMRFLYDITN